MDHHAANFPSESPPDDSKSANFHTTQWSAVLLAAERSSLHAQQALADLCEAYWFPLYAYVRSRVGDRHQAQDLTQTFFATLLEKDYLRSVDPAKGRFRAFLLTALKRLLANEWNRATAIKRGGGRPTVSLDFDSGERQIQLEAVETLTAEQIFLRNWVRTVLDRVFERLRQEFSAAGKANHFEELKAFVTPQADSVPVADVAERLGMSEGAVRVAAHRLRKRYRQFLRDEVATTVSDPDDVEGEIRILFAAFG